MNNYLGKTIKQESPMETDSVRALEDELNIYNDLNVNLVIAWILEEIDNALAKGVSASKISINIYEKLKETYIDVLDDGIGINCREMEEVLKLHGATSNRTVGNIAFRGMGGKLSLSIGARLWEKISKTQQFKGIVGRAYPKVESRRKFKTSIYELGATDPIPTETGTLTRAVFPKNIIKKIWGELDKTEIIRAIQRYQESNLIGGVKREGGIPISIKLNDEKPITIRPRYPHPNDVAYPNHKYKTITKTKYAPTYVLSTYSEEGYGEDAGIFVIVGGRMIEQYTDWFGLQFDGDARDKIRTLIFADELIDFVENGKARLNRRKQTSSDYKKWKTKVVSEIREFLKRLDIQIFDQNKSLSDSPDISRIESMINQDIIKLKIRPPSDDGDKGTGNSEFPDMTKYKRKCPNCGSTNLKDDPDDNTKYICRDCNLRFDKKWTKKPKEKIQIFLRKQGDDVNKNYPFISDSVEYNFPAFYNDEMKIIYVNISITPYKRADKIGKDVRNYYIYYVVLESVLKETTNDIQKSSELMNKIFNYRR